ncbi:MAG: hypothetical protein K2L54_04445, partial [Clostridiales bacterium]|nr:hypothetical protein [Clostridiales bacterium]
SGTKDIPFEIRAVENEWVEMPNIIRWKYGAFNPESSVIIVSPKFILDSEMLGVSILDGNGGELTIDGVSLSDIKVERVKDADYGWCYVVSDEEVIAAINKLEVARYVLKVWLDGTTSYSELEAREITFNIAQNNNYWDETPSIESWTEGGFDDVNLPSAVAHFGNDGLRIVIVDVEDETKVYYDNANGINRLYDLSAGVYYLTASVEGNNNYQDLTYNQLFRVLSKSSDIVITQGMPWWGVLLIVIGVVAVIVIVMLVLHIKGVLQLLTGKMVIRMRAKADVDATIAAVRAGRMAAAQSAESTATMTEKEEKKTIKKAENLEKKAKTPEEKAAELEAK